MDNLAVNSGCRKPKSGWIWQVDNLEYWAMRILDMNSYLERWQLSIENVLPLFIGIWDRWNSMTM